MALQVNPNSAGFATTIDAPLLQIAVTNIAGFVFKDNL
jgi:hypothetical protein